MISAIEWRKHLLKGNDKRKLFDNWDVLMVNQTKQTIPYAQVLKCGNANVVDLSDDLQLQNLDQFKYCFIDQNQVKELSKFAIKVIKELIKLNKLLKIDFVSHYILNGPNPSLFSSTFSKLLVKDSIFNNFETSNSRKRVRDDSEDFDDDYPLKHNRFR